MSAPAPVRVRPRPPPPLTHPTDCDDDDDGGGGDEIDRSVINNNKRGEGTTTDDDDGDGGDGTAATKSNSPRSVGRSVGLRIDDATNRGEKERCTRVPDFLPRAPCSECSVFVFFTHRGGALHC